MIHDFKTKRKKTKLLENSYLGLESWVSGKALVAPPGDLGLMPNIHIVLRDPLEVQSQGLNLPLLNSKGTRH